MATWEAEVEMTVRKTLRFQGPMTEREARAVVETQCTPAGLWQQLAHLEAEFGMARPVERMIGNEAAIVSIKKLED